MFPELIKHALKRILIFLALITTFSLIISNNNIRIPVAKKIFTEITIRNYTLSDNYSWLKNINSDKDVIKYINEENIYSDFVLRRTKPLQNALIEEMSNYDNYSKQTSFWEYGSFTYYISYDKQFPVYNRIKTNGCLQDNLNFTSSQIVLDYNVWIDNSVQYFSTGIFEVSENEELIAFSYDTNGSENFALRVLNLTSGKLIDIPDAYTYYSARWKDSIYIYYNVVDSIFGVPMHIDRICISCDTKVIERIYSEDDISFIVELVSTNDHSFLFIKVSGQVTSEYRFSETPKIALLKREKNIIYDVEYLDSFFYFRVNLKSNFEIFQIDSQTLLNNMGTKSVKEIMTLNSTILVAHSYFLFIEMMEIFQNQMVLWIRKNGLREIMICEFYAFEKCKFITFAIPQDASTESYSVYPSNSKSMESRIYRNYQSKCMSFTNSSFSTTPSTFVFDFINQTIFSYGKKPGIKFENYKEKRIWITSTKSPNVTIPISILYHINDIEPRPVVISSYGAYSSFSDPEFNSDLFPLLDRHVSFAICHPRGDGDMGAKWYTDGKYEKKVNTFSDTNDCIEGLISQNIAMKGRIFTRSAGGLVAGYAINHFKNVAAVVSQVPFVDPLRDMSDKKVPWTAFEWNEWGNPLESDLILNSMINYSPYDNINENSGLPAVMITAGLEDSRVPYWEPVKLVAKLRASTKNRNIILRVSKTGHYSDSKLERAEWYAFVLNNILF